MWSGFVDSWRRKREVSGTSLPRERRWMFRIAALAFGLGLLGLVEGALVLLDWGAPDAARDPFLGFQDVRPLFVLSQDGQHREIDAARHEFFRPESFPRVKTKGAFRIFCLGGSTVQGRPFAVETSFTTWLELSLRAAEPARTWDVVNCGGVSYASYRLVPVLEEVLQYEPDLIIVYTGHNEFLEDRTYRHLKRVPGWIAAPANALLETRICGVLRKGLVSLRGRRGPAAAEGRPKMRSEVDAMLDYRDGLADYHRDEPWRNDVIDHFHHNLRRMQRMTQQAGVPLLFLNPVSNLRDCPPFKSQHGDDLTAAEQERWQSLLDQVEDTASSNPRRANQLLRQAEQLDPEHAGIHFRLGDSCDRLGMKAEAKAQFLLAKETDVCPLRMLEPMHVALVETVDETDAWLVDVRQRFVRISRDGIPDGEHLLDHVHPSIEGHKRIASWILEELVRRGVVKTAAGWEAARDTAYREHMDSLDDLYYQTGIQRLENLRRWTQGRADGRFGSTPATRSEASGQPVP
jgi:lysophospholipase L1-like esterase